MGISTALIGLVEGHKQRKAQAAAMDAARAAALQPGPQEAKTPGLRQQSFQRPGMPAPGSTLLTGPSGVDAGSGSLGKNTLLGG